MATGTILIWVGGFRLTAEDLPLGDSNRGRVVIDGIRLWIKEADIRNPTL